MLTRNWYNQMRSNISQTIILQGLKNTSGAMYDSGYNGSSIVPLTFAYSATVRPSYSNGSIILGSGRTPATVDDYKLENLITTSLASTVTDVLDGYGNAVRVFTITNGSSSPIDINEIGWCENCYIRAGASGYQVCLLDRQVLPQTVTIPAGGVGQIKYTIMLPQIPE